MADFFTALHRLLVWVEGLFVPRPLPPTPPRPRRALITTFRPVRTVPPDTPLRVAVVCCRCGSLDHLCLTPEQSAGTDGFRLVSHHICKKCQN